MYWVFSLESCIGFLPLNQSECTEFIINQQNIQLSLLCFCYNHTPSLTFLLHDKKMSKCSYLTQKFFFISGSSFVHNSIENPLFFRKRGQNNMTNYFTVAQMKQFLVSESSFLNLFYR